MVIFVGLGCLLSGCDKVNEIKIEIHKNQGRECYDQGKYEEVIVEYKKVIEINPNSTRAHYNLGVVYMQQGKLDNVMLPSKK